MSKKQQERKKKKREEIAKKRVLARRNSLRKQSSEEKKAARLDKKFRQKAQPIIKDENKRKIMEDLRNEKILSKLEQNAEILKALEAQYQEEINSKKNINQELESEGCATLKEKLDLLDKKAQENMTESEKQSGMIDFSEK